MIIIVIIRREINELLKIRPLCRQEPCTGIKMVNNIKKNIKRSNHRERQTVIAAVKLKSSRKHRVSIFFFVKRI